MTQHISTLPSCLSSFHSFSPDSILGMLCYTYVTYRAETPYQYIYIDFMVTTCINNIQHFNFQLMHTTLKNVQLLKCFKIGKTAPTCFGLQGNHHRGATIST